MNLSGQKQEKIFVQEAVKLNPQQRQVYNAVADEINAILKHRKISGFQALIEILIKRDILSFSKYFELDDEGISTKEVSELFVSVYGTRRKPDGNTVRNLARKYNLGVKIGENFHHSKKKWTEYLEIVCSFKER